MTTLLESSATVSPSASLATTVPPSPKIISPLRSLHEAQSARARKVLRLLYAPDVSAAKQAMVNLAVEQVNDLLRLPEGWDGRRGRRVTKVAAEGAVLVAFAVVVEQRARPQIFPLPNGGLQIEWHFAGNDVEVEVDADGSLHVLAIESDDGKERVIVDAEAEDVYSAESDLLRAHEFLVAVVSSRGQAIELPAT